MVGRGGGGGGASSKLRSAARKVVLTCGSFSRRQALLDPVLTETAISAGSAAAINPPKRGTISEIGGEAECGNNMPATKNLCAICLDPLSYSTGSSPGQAIFTAQCSHAFHFACISSNVRHGSVTCPICRAHWTQLPRNLKPIPSYNNNNNPLIPSTNQTDPILRILDDSIATFRVHRRSFLRSARYDDDDPIEPHHPPTHHHPGRLHFNLIPHYPTCFHPHYLTTTTTSSSASSLLLPPAAAGQILCTTSSSSSSSSSKSAHTTTTTTTYSLSVKLAHQQATDLVLVASPNGPHLRLLKQSMALVVFSLRPIDRLAIVTYSSAAARVFPLRRMTSYGKRTALQVIDRLFYMGQADPIEGLKKGMKILEDRAHKNPESFILHLSDSPTRSYHHRHHRRRGVGEDMEPEVPIPVHRFHVGFGFGTSNGFVMHEFEEFLGRLLGGVIRETQLRINGDQEDVVWLGELRGGEERIIPLDLGSRECGQVRVGYSYVEGGHGVDDDDDQCSINIIRRGETVVGVIGIGGGDKGERRDDDEDEEGATGGRRDVSIIGGGGGGGGGRSSSVESWDYHDPYMARRWAKHLHGYRL